MSGANFWRSVDWSQTNETIAHLAKCSVYTVRNNRRRYGRPILKVDWSDVDWRKSDSAISVDFGVDRQTVAKYRRLSGFDRRRWGAARQRRVVGPWKAVDLEAARQGVSWRELVRGWICDKLDELAMARGVDRHEYILLGMAEAWRHEKQRVHVMIDACAAGKASTKHLNDALGDAAVALATYIKERERTRI